MCNIFSFWQVDNLRKHVCDSGIMKRIDLVIVSPLLRYQHAFASLVCDSNAFVWIEKLYVSLFLKEYLISKLLYQIKLLKMRKSFIFHFHISPMSCGLACFFFLLIFDWLRPPLCFLGTFFDMETMHYCAM